MVKREKLTLRKPTPADPVKIALSLQIGFRYVDRAGRYIAQVYVYKDPVFGVRYEHANSTDRTWVDIPLVPETYEAEA